MKKDYSEYQYSEYDKYLIKRSNQKGVKLDYFVNKVHFSPEDKKFNITVDDYNEYTTIQDEIDEYEKAKAEREGKPYIPREIDFESEDMQELRKESEERLAAMRKKYNFMPSDLAGDAVDETGKLDMPMNNVFSGARIFMNYGEGILDFIYADFVKPVNDLLAYYQIEFALAEYAVKHDLVKRHKKPEEEQKKKIYNAQQEVVESYYDFEETFSMIEDIAYSSLYSAVCPPLFVHGKEQRAERLRWYGNYLIRLQKEFTEMIEFCYDEDFYPGLFSSLYPSERLSIYRQIKKLPSFFQRKEQMILSKHVRGGKKMPFGLDDKELLQAFSHIDLIPTEDAIEFSEKYGMPAKEVMYNVQHPIFMSISYDARTIEDMLELEFTKMLEQDVRFRKCRRCGKYFITECARGSGEPCVRPELMRYSVESIGGDVLRSLRDFFGEEVEWAENGRLPGKYILLGALLKP